MPYELSMPLTLTEYMEQWVKGSYPKVVEDLEEIERSISLEQLASLASIGEATLDDEDIPDENVIDWGKELGEDLNDLT